MDNIIRLRGLPFKVTESDIRSFFKDLDCKHIDVDLESAEAFVCFETAEEKERAMSFDRQHMQSRYIEIYSSCAAQRQRMIDAVHNQETDGVLRMLGLPYNATQSNIVDFFKGFYLDSSDIVIGYHASGWKCGKPTGEAYVQFTDQQTAEDARARCHKDTIGGRYIELFPSTKNDWNIAYSISNKNTNPRLLARGLPYSVTVEDVVSFFEGFGVTKGDVTFVPGVSPSRPSGEAYISFMDEATAEKAKAALDRSTLGTRYIELY